MELNDRDIDWQKDAPTLAALGKKIPFTVPDHYFDQLSQSIKAQVLIETVRFSDSDEFATPTGYFNDLSSRIESRIFLEELKNKSGNHGFTVPEAYFGDLSAKLQANIVAPKAKQPPVRRLLKSWISYAAAACVTVAIGSVVYLNSTSYQFNKQLSEVSDEEIINYLQVHSTAGDTPFIIENLSLEEFEQINPDVSAEDLENYINNTTL